MQPISTLSQDYLWRFPDDPLTRQGLALYRLIRFRSFWDNHAAERLLYLGWPLNGGQPRIAKSAGGIMQERAWFVERQIWEQLDTATEDFQELLYDARDELPGLAGIDIGTISAEAWERPVADAWAVIDAEIWG